MGGGGGPVLTLYVLQVTSCPSEVKEQHVLSSNLPHLEALLLACDHAPGVSAVLQNFWYTRRGGCGSDGCGDGSVLVDVVAGEGSCWVKVFARKRSALHLCWLGGWMSVGMDVCMGGCVQVDMCEWMYGCMCAWHV